MSVINKMLQDLDARGLQTARSDFSNVRSVPEGTRRLETNVLIGLGGVAAVALVGLAVWHYSAAPVVAAQPLVQLAVVMPAPPLEPPAPLEEALPLEVVTLAPVPVVAEAAPPQATAVEPAPRRPARVAESRSKPQRFDDVERTERPVQRIARIETAAPVAERSAPRTRNAESAGNTLQTKQANPRQEAENEYRRALGLVQDGRITAGISGLEQSLRLFPRHDAARQTLIGLLLESRRPDDAIQQLEQGLAQDAGQTAMAMTLARLQVERSGPALQTLQRSLPHAQDNAEYQGFIAALLQREQRHKDAIEHYTSALRMQPKNGIWWMGLGISLQADQRLPDARVAFQKAKASGSLDGELPSYVDKKLQQLGR